MIENALVFALGALAAGLLALVLFPAFTRRAARLARRDIEASLPRSLSDIAAARDGIRATYAAQVARLEHELADARRVLTEERVARAADQDLIARAGSEAAAKDNAVAEADARTDAVRAELRQRDEALARIGVERRDLERRLQSEIDARRAAEDRAEEVAGIATELRLALAAAEARAASLDDAATDRVLASAAAIGNAIPPVQPPTRADAAAFGLPGPAPAGEGATRPGPGTGDGPSYEDPVERARRVDELAERLKALKRHNAAARARLAETPSTEPPVDGGPARRGDDQEPRAIDAASSSML